MTENITSITLVNELRVELILSQRTWVPKPRIVCRYLVVSFTQAIYLYIKSDRKGLQTNILEEYKVSMINSHDVKYPVMLGRYNTLSFNSTCNHLVTVPSIPPVFI